MYHLHVAACLPVCLPVCLLAYLYSCSLHVPNFSCARFVFMNLKESAFPQQKPICANRLSCLKRLLIAVFSTQRSSFMPSVGLVWCVLDKMSQSKVMNFIINNQRDAALSSLICYTLWDYMFRVLSAPIIRST
jgi:hypothetical protein